MVIDNINSFIQEKGIKQSRISQLSGIVPSKLSLSLNKKRTLSPDELARVLFALTVIIPGTDLVNFLIIDECKLQNN